MSSMIIIYIRCKIQNLKSSILYFLLFCFFWIFDTSIIDVCFITPLQKNMQKKLFYQKQIFVSVINTLIDAGKHTHKMTPFWNSSYHLSVTPQTARHTFKSHYEPKKNIILHIFCKNPQRSQIHRFTCSQGRGKIVRFREGVLRPIGPIRPLGLRPIRPIGLRPIRPIRPIGLRPVGPIRPIGHLSVTVLIVLRS